MKRSKPDVGQIVRVLLVDQDPAFGDRLAQALEGAGEFELCGHALDPAAADKAVAEENPDLVIADTDQDRTGALPLIVRLAASPERRLLATSDQADPAEAERVLRAGALGFLLKTEPTEEILTALRTVVQGHMYVSQTLSIPLLKRLLQEPGGLPRGGVDRLTDRELRVFELLGAGLSKREVAARLGLSCKTVESHRAKIQHRLGLDSSAALTRYACAWAQRGLRAGRSQSNGDPLGTPAPTRHNPLGKSPMPFSGDAPDGQNGLLGA
jgi:DNA-binding NarL/FixJ family response regulator